jgi:small subunit ribosomal protein S16
MLKIRMQRTGRTNMPSFRIVVVEHTASPKAGSFVDKVGTYNPKTKEKTLDESKIKHWLSVGAHASPTVHNMLVSAGIVSGKKINVLPAYKAPEAEAPAETPAAAPAAEVPAEAAAETPAQQ